MSKEIDPLLLVRYLNGECTDAERLRIERETDADALQALWRAAAERPLHWDVEGAWRETAGTLGLAPASGQTMAAAPVDRSPRGRQRRRRAVEAAVGALVLIVLTVTAVRLAGPATDAASPNTRVYTTARGERTTVQLTDGTRVSLNAGSRLSVSYATGRRDVVLEGQAYFDVARDPARPFVVHSRAATVQVLGTRFDVAAYPEDARVLVTVAEGSVDVRARGAGQAVLKPGDIGAVREGEDPDVHHVASLDPYIGWTDGRLVFARSPFPEVMLRLKRWYGVDVRFEGNPTDVLRLDVAFENEPLPVVLDIVSGALDLEYDLHGDVVTFHPARSH